MMEFLKALGVAGILVLTGATLEALIGLFLFYAGYKERGHYLVGVSGLMSHWLARECPYSSCDNCHVWTCADYSSCTKKDDEEPIYCWEHPEDCDCRSCEDWECCHPSDLYTCTKQDDDHG